MFGAIAVPFARPWKARGFHVVERALPAFGPQSSHSLGRSSFIQSENIQYPYRFSWISDCSYCLQDSNTDELKGSGLEWGGFGDAVEQGAAFAEADLNAAEGGEALHQAAEAL